MSERLLLGIIGVLLLVVGLLVGLLVGGGNDDEATLATASTTTTETPTTEASTTSAPPTTTTAAPSTTTTEPAAPASGVVVAATGVAGWSVDGEWVRLGDGQLPAAVGETYTVVRVGEPTTTAVAGAVGAGCEFIDGSAWVDGLIDGSWGSDTPLAVAADWEVVPHNVELLSTDSEVYRDIVSEVLAGRGVVDPAPVLRQVVRTDLEGDGVDEVIITAGHDGEFGAGSTLEDGDYSIAILRRLVEGEVQTAILGFFLYELDPEAPSIYILTYRVSAVADLNGDGRMEIAVNDRYYEGSGTVVYDYVNDDLGPVQVLNVGCGV